MQPDRPAQGSTADYCSRWPGEPHAISVHMRNGIAVRRCDSCGWIDFDDLRAQQHTAYERGKAEDRRERALAALVRDVPDGVRCRINGGPWAPFTLMAGRRGADGLFDRQPEWSGAAAMAALGPEPSDWPRIGPVTVEVSMWGVLMVGDAHLNEISVGWPGDDGARLVGRVPLRLADAAGGSDAA